MGQSCSTVGSRFCAGGCPWKCSCTCCPKGGNKDTCPLPFDEDILNGPWGRYVPGFVKTSNEAELTGDFKCHCAGLAVFIVWVSLVVLALLALALFVFFAWRRGWWCFGRDTKQKPPPEPQHEPQWQSTTPGASPEIQQQGPIVYPPMAYQAPAPAIGYPMPQPGIVQMITKDAKPGVLKEPKPVGF